MNKSILRITALLLVLFSLFSVVAVSVSAAESEAKIGESSLQVKMTPETVQSTRIALSSTVAAFKCAIFTAKVLKSINAVFAASKADKSFAEICDSAIDAFLGRITPDVPSADDFAKQYELMRSEIWSVHEKLGDLEDDLAKINNSITDLNNTIIAEGNKEYINDFRKNYVDLTNDMLYEYEQLMVTLDNDDKSIDSVKLDYDDLYIASTRLNNMLYEYMTGSYREDGLAIYEVMFQYVDSTSGVSQSEIYSRCIGFSEELYSTYALSMYYLLLCNIYQMEYCNYYDQQSYVTQNEAPESLPRNSIVSSVTRMETKYDNIVEGVGKYIISCGNYDMDILYMPAVNSETYSVKFTEIKSVLYNTDKYYVSLPLSEDYGDIFSHRPLILESSDTSVATVSEDGEITFVADSGAFALNLKYGDKILAVFNFSVRAKTVASGYGIDSSPYLVSSKDELMAATRIGNARIKLIDNINLEAETYQNAFVVNTFAGVLDGNGYAISNAIIQENGSTNIGFFASLSGGIIKNLTLANITLKKGAGTTNPTYFGVLCAHSSGIVYNCITESCRIDFGTFTTDKTTRLHMGGLVGENSGLIQNSTVSSFQFTVSSQINFRSFLTNEYDIKVGCLVGNANTNSSYKNNLVKNSRILYSALFVDTYKSTATRPLSNSVGIVMGNRNAYAAEALYVNSSAAGSAYSEIYVPLSSSTTRNTLSVPNYSGTKVSDVSNLSDYRVSTYNGYTVDDDVFSELILHKAPNKTTYTLGEELELFGLKLRIKYESSLSVLVPFTSVSGFDPDTLGEQTVTVTYVGNRGRSIETSFTVTVVCAHDWVFDRVITEPTHFSPGEAQNICTICGATETYELEADPEHNLSAWQIESPETCTSAGVKVRRCLDSSCNYEERETIDAKGHTPGAEATCGSAQTCTVCNETLANALSHNYVAVITKPTCLAQGYTTHTCSKCSDSYVDTYTDAKGHTPGAEATCGSAQTCTVCNETLANALSHNYVAVITQPTCLAQGYTTHTCSKCSDSYVDTYTDTIGHTPEAPATCTSAERCSVCNSVTESALGHSYAPVVTAPGCTTQGYTTYSCIRCSSNYVDNYTSPSGHTPGDVATCTTAQLCTVCSAIIINANGHSYEVDVVAPTCLNKGYTMHTCTVCLYSYNDSFLDKTEHTPSDWIVDAPASVGVSGKEHKECTVCRAILESRDTAPLVEPPEANDPVVDNDTEETPSDSASECDHICHKDGFFARFWWGISRLFARIFGSNKTCPCGAKHY